MRTPVLFLIFNRPANTAKVLEAIRAARPPRLYVGSDGPRKGSSDAAKVESCRQLITQLDWPCEVRTLYRQTNLGCAQAVSESIDWFFSHEAEGIILEDDCLPDPTFFPFCEELLDRYRYVAPIWTISGNALAGNDLCGDASYTFSKYFHCWGWATWRRTWEKASKNRAEPCHRFLSFNTADLDDGNSCFRSYWRSISKMYIRGGVDSWAYPFLFDSLMHEALHIHPCANLVSNIGFGSDATHTQKAPKLPKAETLPLPLLHPNHIQRNRARDRMTDREHFRINYRMVAKQSLRQLKWCLKGLARSTQP